MSPAWKFRLPCISISVDWSAGRSTIGMGSRTSRTAFVETVDHDSGPEGDMHEWRSVSDAFKRRGYKVLRFTANEIAGQRLGITVATPVVGGRQSMRLALRTCKVITQEQPLPERSDYPLCLSNLLGRRITPSVLSDALKSSHVFVKPRGASSVKIFTGFVLSDNIAESHQLEALPPDTPVWCSEVLTGLVSEWRCYVLDGKVEAAVCYKGNEAVAPDLKCVEDAAATLHASDEGSAAFALDMGVVVAPHVKTVLIEVNDGFALGLYPGCPDDLYARMMVARWDEMVAGRAKVTCCHLVVIEGTAS